ncbi:MAG TPA: DinB family protein [Armatimonadota bacterium]|jgi:hypothetical protein
MSDVLSDRCDSAYRALLESIDGVGDEEAAAFREENWPDHEGRVGEDGSIAGLVWHCAAWKAMWVTYFDTGVYPEKTALHPAEDTWPGRQAWLTEMHARLMEHVRRHDGEDTSDVYGKPCRMADYDITNGEHDAYHAAQIWYIRQRYAAGRPGGQFE